MVLLVGSNIAKLRERLQLLHDPGSPLPEFGGASILETVLILGAADTILYGQILHRLHVKRDARDVLHSRLQATDDGGGVVFSIITGLEIDEEASLVGRGVGAIDSDEGSKAVDVGIFEDRIG